MKNLNQKDKSRRFLFSRQELQRIQYKSIIQNQSISLEKRLECVKKLNSLPRNGSLIRIRNRCILTGRSRGVYRFCKLSRTSLRQLASQGELVGISKISW